MCVFIITHLHGGCEGLQRTECTRIHIHVHIQETERVRRASENRMHTLVRTVREAEELQTQVHAEMQQLTEEKRTLEMLVGELRERETQLLRENEVYKALVCI
jgi:hypothetical protein